MFVGLEPHLISSVGTMYRIYSILYIYMILRIHIYIYIEVSYCFLLF